MNVDTCTARVASALQEALRAVSDNFGARLVVERARIVGESIASAVGARSELLTSDDPRAVLASRRAFDLIVWVDEHAHGELQRRLDAALDRSVARDRELRELRDQVDRAARSVLATTHNSRRRT